MILSWMRRKTARRARRDRPATQLKMDNVIPDYFCCPISLDLIRDPVTLSSGITYDRDSIEMWFEAGNFTCPVTNQVLASFELIPNHTLRKLIQEWCVKNQQHGIQRIPTPRIPVSPSEVSKLLLRVTASAHRLNQSECLELVQKMKKWTSEFEPNRRRVVDNGARVVLASALDVFANDSIGRNANLLEEILCLLNCMMPIDDEAQKFLGSEASLRCMVWFLRYSHISSKQNSILVLRELLSCNQKLAESLAGIEGISKILVDLIRNQISPTITKSSLMLIFNLVSFSSCPEPSNKITCDFLEMDLVSILLEIIIDCETSICEKALAVFDGLCSCEKGREKASGNVLTIPVLGRRILRVSQMASECSVSGVWKLCKFESREEGRVSVMVEAIQVGVFQKLVLMLQIGCGDETKEKASELLKLMNPLRPGLECVDSLDFKNLKRCF